MRGFRCREPGGHAGEVLLGLGRVDPAKFVSPRMAGQDAVLAYVGDHVLRSVGGQEVAALVIIPPLGGAEIAEMIEKESSEQPRAHAQFEQPDLRLQHPALLGLVEVAEQELGRAHGQVAVAGNGERNAVADEGPDAAARPRTSARAPTPGFRPAAGNPGA